MIDRITPRARQPCFVFAFDELSYDTLADMLPEERAAFSETIVTSPDGDERVLILPPSRRRADP